MSEQSCPLCGRMSGDGHGAECLLGRMQPEQADRREADREGASSPSTDQATGDCPAPSPSAYHRKLGSYSAAQANNNCRMDEKQWEMRGE